MCTAATYQTKDFYFGRTLDYEISYQEEISVTPRHFPFRFTENGMNTDHYAMIGMASVMDDYPLYYDAVNEKGLGMAGLNFVGNAHYHPSVSGKDNVSQYELIPWILCQCATVEEAVRLIDRINITDKPFRSDLPVAQLHWMIADKNASITVEPARDGIRVYNNPVGVLTNNPPFDMQMFQLNNYRNLSAAPLGNNFSEKLDLTEYSRGMGAMGLPGDLSSQSRFVRVAFTKMNSISEEDEMSSVSQFFHILGSVEQQRGCCRLPDGQCEITIYTSCCNTAKGIYYYTTYDNHQITAVELYKTDPEGTELSRYPLIRQEQIRYI